MSNIDFMEKLLDGKAIEWKLLGEVAIIQRGRRLVKSQLEDFGDYAVYQNSMTPLGYYHESNVKADTTFIISAGAAGEIGYSDIDFWAADDVYFVLTLDNIMGKFLYYFLLTQQNKILSQVRRASIPRLSKTVIEKLKIPIPPLPVQVEIVRILDAFTAMTAELTAELKLRQQQYQYFREKLLTFDLGATQSSSDEIGRDRTRSDEIGRRIEVEWKMLGEIGEVRMCKRILKNQTSSEGEIPFYKIGTFGKEPDAYISRKLFEEYKAKYNYPNIGEVLISASGTIGRTVIFDGQDSYFQDSNIVWIENDESIVLNKFLFYFYKIANWGISDGGTIQRLYNDNLRKLKIPIVTLVEQARIVAILDKFDILTNSIREGLPCEIKLRQQQYEYYRELLLSFPKVATEA